MNTTFALIGDTLDTFATALGLVWMQKAILNKRTSLWFAGFGLEFFAGIAHIFVLPYANLVLLTSTSSLAVVFSVMLAIGVLGEKINPKYDIASVVLIVTGSVLTIGLANPSDKVFTKNTVKQRLSSTASIWFIGLAVVTYAATALVVRRFVKRLKQVRG
jgi:hypothetical protein